MKTAIYIEDGVVQLVLTPDNEFERNALSAFNQKNTETKIIRGQFYDCSGGWTRMKELPSLPPMARAFSAANTENSLIIRLQPEIIP